ncbi:hypothetical protein B0H11DRAFT_2113750 [Mycena galericulata]|nr:hypothetical protein B0H11DRAFT_2113750 [Mycena galericulata]
MDDPKSIQERHPEMFVRDANIDRHACRRVVPMEVLSLGMSRTGTASMKAALEILGYKDCYHFCNVFTNIRDCDMWMEAFAAKYQGKGKFGRAEFDKLLGHCMAVTDAPCNAFAPELIEAYPEAKVILVERDLEAWYTSFNIVLETIFQPHFRVAVFLDPFWNGKLGGMVYTWMIEQFGAPNLEKGRQNARKVYQEHYAEFLGKDVPDMSFPRITDAAKDVARALRNVVGAFMFCAAVGIIVHVMMSTGA